MKYSKSCSVFKRKEKAVTMASESKTKHDCIATDWLEEDNLMLLECWARDGYTYTDIANRIGIDLSTLKRWRVQYPEINEALRKGREIIDYKVENALLKSALGYKTKEVKVTTTMRRGEVVETIRETTHKEQAPNVSAIQCWLYNRLPDKWKKNRDNLIPTDDDTTIQVTVTRASQKTNSNAQQNNGSDDEDWEDEVNESIEIRGMTQEEIAQKKKEKENQQKQTGSNKATKVESEIEDDLDYWPDDWEDEEEWED